MKNDVHLLAHDAYVNEHIGNKNTQFAGILHITGCERKAVTLVVSPLNFQYSVDIIAITQIRNTLALNKAHDKTLHFGHA